MEVANHAMRPGILIGIAFSQAEEGVEASTPSSACEKAIPIKIPGRIA